MICAGNSDPEELKRQAKEVENDADAAARLAARQKEVREVWQLVLLPGPPLHDAVVWSAGVYGAFGGLPAILLLPWFTGVWVACIWSIVFRQ